MKIAGAVATIVDNTIMWCGGHDGNTYTDYCEKLDLEEKEWKRTVTFQKRGSFAKGMANFKVEESVNRDPSFCVFKHAQIF